MNNKLLVILGTTSTGKTDLALDLAKKLNGEIVSADSRQVYKFLDIGTGKLPANFEILEKNDNFWKIDGVEIWMYDTSLPECRFNLYEYIKKSQTIIENITRRGKLPILVGGTGLYIRSLLEGITNYGISEDADLREELEELDVSELKKRIDPKVLKNLNNSDINNKRRLIRLVELTSQTKSEETFEGLEGKYEILKVGLTLNREDLKDRISKRLISRINQGMIEESKELLDKGILNYQRMEELGLEYRYLAKFIKGEIKQIEDFLNQLTIKISQYAKRQETWFKKEKNVVWFDITAKDWKTKLENKLQAWYN